MSVLNYSIVTDPISLHVSQPGTPSMGTVYVIVSNANSGPVEWEYIGIEVPVGNSRGDLTDNPAVIVARRPELGYSYPLLPDPTFTWDSALGIGRAAHPSGPGNSLTLPEGAHFVLALENIPVSAMEGLVCLKISENAKRDNDNPLLYLDRTITLGLLKSPPKILEGPRNFRPEKNSLVDVDARENVVLQWEGPDNLDYRIRDPKGNEVLVQSAAQGPSVTQKPYTWSPTSAPKRGTTYTLVAGTAGAGQQQQGYFLTTTVHAQVPEFESGTRSPWVEGTSDKGRVAFSAEGVEIRKGLDWGTVAAHRADVTGVNTKWVQGRNADDGWIDFYKGGLKVHQDGKNELGTVLAGKAHLVGLFTHWVQGRGDNIGRIAFVEWGVGVGLGIEGKYGIVAARQFDRHPNQ